MWSHLFCKPVLLAGALLAVVLSFSLSAYSQNPKLIPSSTGEFKLLEANPPLLVHAPNGPAKAKGLIYFIAGWAPEKAKVKKIALPFFITTLSTKGWDVIGAKVDNFNSLLLDNKKYPVDFGVHRAALFVERRIRELKSEGYKRIILGGHSWGAWAAMLVANNPDSSLGIEALLLSAPSAFGPRFTPTYELALTEFGPDLKGVRVPTVLIIPDDFVYDPDPAARAEIAEKYFTQAQVPHLIIAKPPGFEGHMAPWFPVFDFAYGGCIQSFLETHSSAACRTPPLSDDDFRSIFSLDQIKDAESKRLMSAELLDGKTFLIYTVDGKSYRFTSPTQGMGPILGKDFVGYESSQEITFRAGLHCAGDRCSELIRWSDDKFLEFDPKTRDLFGWWIEER